MSKIMPYKRKKTFDVKLDEKDKLLLETQSKRQHLDQKEIVGHLIGLNEKYNFFGASDWKDRLLADDESRERHTRLEGSCPALIESDKEVWCVWGVDGKPPAKKKLSEDYDTALEMCQACKKTLEIKMENESYQVKVQELEMKLKAQSTKKFKIPQCNNGARLDGDGLAFEGCPRSPGKSVSIEGYCKKIKNGAGCDWFKSRLVGVSAKK